MQGRGRCSDGTHNGANYRCSCSRTMGGREWGGRGKGCRAVLSARVRRGRNSRLSQTRTGTNDARAHEQKQRAQASDISDSKPARAWVRATAFT